MKRGSPQFPKLKKDKARETAIRLKKKRWKLIGGSHSKLEEIVKNPLGGKGALILNGRGVGGKKKRRSNGLNEAHLRRDRGGSKGLEKFSGGGTEDRS